jgi:hypothetical protein
MSTIQAYTTATRPSASASNVGLTIFNTTDKSINVSDGASWRGYAYDGAAAQAISNSYNLSFDGTGDIVNLGVLNSLLDDYTNSVSVWFKLDSATDTDPYHLFGLDNASASTRGIRVLKFYDTGALKHGLEFSVYDDDSGASYLYEQIRCEITPDTAWHNVVATHYIDPSNAANNRLKLYYDGQELTPYDEQAAGTLNALAKPSSLNYTVGARNTTSPALIFEGDIDEVAFWDVELDAANAAQIYNSFGGGKPFDLSSNAGDYNQSANLQGWWRFENNGDDETGNSSAATVSGAVYVSNTL